MKKICILLLTILSISSAVMASSDAQQCIQDAIENNESDVQLFVSNCGVTNSDLAMIIDFFNTHPNYQELYLDNNKINDAGAKQLAQLKISYISLSNNSIGADGARSISNNNTFTTLWIDNNPIGDAGVMALAESKNLQDIYLGNTNMTAVGAIRLAQNNMLTGVSIDNNNIGDEGVAAFSKSKNLVYLSSNNNHVTDAGAIALAQSNSIKSLLLGYNQITDQGAYALAHANGPLDKYLYIANNLLTEIGKSTLKNSPVYNHVCTDDNDCL